MTGKLGIRLTTLSRWMAFALDPATAEQAIEREVDAHIARRPQLTRSRALLVDLLTSTSAGARSEEATLGAMRYEELPSCGSSIASMTAWLIDRNPHRSVREEIDDNLARLTVQTRLDQFAPRVERVGLPFGDAVRVETARRVPSAFPLAADQRPLFQTVEYHIPLDTPTPSLLFVRFTTSNLVDVGQLTGEFHTIVEGLELAPCP